MPMYDYKCECGLAFEALVRSKDEAPDKECPSCGEMVPKNQAPSFLGFLFGSGNTPGNTGVDSLDSSIDKMVGRDADQRWEDVKDRNSYKRKVRDKYGAKALKKTTEGDYEVMDDEEIERSKNLSSEYGEIYQEHQSWREKKGIPKFEDEDSSTE